MSSPAADIRERLTTHCCDFVSVEVSVSVSGGPRLCELCRTEVDVEVRVDVDRSRRSDRQDSA